MSQPAQEPETPSARIASDESVDQLGIPLSREPTLDDVRGDGEQHRRLAIGCALGVALLVAAFYLVRLLV